MVKCIAVGCKTGYKSTANEEKIGFFSVPKDPKLIKLWQKAILRDDIKLNPSHAVCRKHFMPEDIILERLLLGPDGMILGRSKYKNPKLRPGALPLLYLGRKEKTPKKPRKPPTKRNQKNANVNKENENLEIEEFSPSPSVVIHDEIPLAVKKIDGSLFHEIYTNKDSISYPSSWARSNVTWVDAKALNFSHWIGRKGPNNSFDSVCTKQIIIEENMHFSIKLFGSFVDPNLFGLEENVLHSTQDVKNLIQIVEVQQICQGYPKMNDYEGSTKSFAYTDKVDHLRHINCHMVLQENMYGKRPKSDQCTWCNSIKGNL